MHAFSVVACLSFAVGKFNLRPAATGSRVRQLLRPGPVCPSRRGEALAKQVEQDQVRQRNQQAGKQEVIQPNFSKSDERFSARDTIETADRATTRSGNERGVKLSKLSGYLQRGIQSNARKQTVNDVWLSWSFQANFMYRSVH